MNKIYILPKEADAYGFVKQIAAEKYNIKVSEISLARGNHGKPYFVNLPDFHFNISHSGGLKIVAVSNDNVGVDIEKLHQVNLRVAKRFSKDEYDYIVQNPSPTRFFEIWTKKEAYLKHSGLGLSGGLDTFSVFKTEKSFQTFTFNEYIISVYGENEFELVNCI